MRAVSRSRIQRVAATAATAAAAACAADACAACAADTSERRRVAALTSAPFRHRHRPVADALP